MPNRGPRISPALVGVISAALMFALLFFAFTNVSLFQSNLSMKAQVSSGDTIAPGGDVEVAGVKIGSVKSIDKGDGGGAVVTMAIDTKKITMYRDASLQIRPHGVFGPKFVEINPGTQTAGNFPEGGTVDLKNTSVSVDFEEILNSLNDDTRTSLQTFFYEFGTASENRGADFGNTIDTFQTVSRELTPPLQVISNRRLEAGRFFENNAIVTETYANSPIDKIIVENNDFLTQLDNHRGDLAGVVVHGNNLLGALDSITAGKNVGNLRTILVMLPGFSDQLQRFSNDLGYGTNSLAPVIMPRSGQSMGDIQLAVERTKDAFGQCDIVDKNGSQGTGSPNASDTVHANFTRIVPCTTNGAVTTDTVNGKTVYAHHHVNVLLGLHTQPGASAATVTATGCGLLGLTPAQCTSLNTVAGGLPALALPAAEEEGDVMCGPGSRDQSLHTAWSCKIDPVQSNPIAPFNGPPPPLFGSTSAFTSTTAAGPSLLAPQAPMSYTDLLFGN